MRQYPQPPMPLTPCRHCGAPVAVVNVGVAVVALDPDGESICNGFRWHPTWKEWQSVHPTTHRASGYLAYRIHHCTTPTREGARA